MNYGWMDYDFQQCNLRTTALKHEASGRSFTTLTSMIQVTRSLVVFPESESDMKIKSYDPCHAYLLKKVDMCL